MKNGSQMSLLSGTYIFKTKHHDCIMEVVQGSLKRYLFSIIWLHGDLVIATKIIHKGETLSDQQWY